MNGRDLINDHDLQGLRDLSAHIRAGWERVEVIRRPLYIGRLILLVVFVAGTSCSLLDKQSEPEILAVTTDEGDEPSVGRKKKLNITIVTSDADNDELDFFFTSDGGAFTQSSNDTLQDLFQDSVTVEWEAPSEPGTYTLTLVISDGKSEGTPTSVRVVVTQEAPSADAGLSQLFAYSDTLRVVLNGTGSLDPDGDPLRFRWEQIGGPSVLRGSVAGLPEPDFLAIAPGDYVFVLTVSDDGADTTGFLSSQADTVRIRVSDRDGRDPSG